MRRLILVAVALLVVFAGCTSATDADAGGASDATTATTAASGGSDGDGGDAGGSDGGDGATSWNRFEFREGESYEYEVSLEGEYEGGTLTWEVLDVSGDEVTVEATFEGGDTSATKTVTAPADEVYGQFLLPPFGTFVLLGLSSPFAAVVAEEELAVGDGWSYSGPDGSGSYRVDRTERHAGLDCQVVELTSNETVVYETCVSGEAAMPGHVVVRDEETGDVEVEMTLVAYRRGS